MGGPQTLTLSTAGAAAPAGAGAQILSPLAGGNGDIDWNGQALAAVPANYAMTYFACGTQGRQIAYEVRVNIISPAINVAGAPTKIVTVSSRKSGNNAALSNVRSFAPPVTLRGYAGR